HLPDPLLAGRAPDRHHDRALHTDTRSGRPAAPGGRGGPTPQMTGAGDTKKREAAPIGWERPPACEDDARQRPTLPHPPGCSTIGAGRLNFRVRNVTGCFPSAMATVAK